NGERPFKKGALAARGPDAKSRRKWVRQMTETIAEARACGGAASVKSACRTLSLPRSTWYRRRALALLPDPDIELRDHIQRLALAKSVYGYRRMTAELRREGVIVNHKRVLRIMREDNLRCLRKRR